MSEIEELIDDLACAEGFDEYNTARAALLSAIEKVEQERDELQEIVKGKAEVFVKSAFPTKDGGIDFMIDHPLFGLFVYSFAEIFAELKAENYFEMQVARIDIGDLVVTFQKKDGKTPHELRKEAEQDRDNYRTLAHGLQDKDVTKQAEIEKLEAELKEANEELAHYRGFVYSHPWLEYRARVGAK